MEHAPVPLVQRDERDETIRAELDDFASTREAYEASVLDDTEQMRFIGIIAKAAIMRLKLQNSEPEVIKALISFWWCEEGNDDCFSARYRRLCCEGASLRRDIHHQFTIFHDHQQRAELIARAMHFASFKRFFEELLPHIQMALVKAGMLEGATAVAAAVRGKANGATKTA